MNSDDKIFSIALRVRRVTCEDAYVSVLVTEALMQPEPEPDGTRRLDGEKVLAEAVRLSQHEKVEWRVETSETTPHPLQQPKPDDRLILNSDGIARL